MSADTPNRAALDASRLPDLPNAGYGTRVARELSDAIMFLIRGLERDPLLLLEVIIAGRLRWRKVFIKAYRVIQADEDMADAVFGYLALLAKRHGADPHAAKARIEMAIQHAQRQSWDKRLRTALALSKDARALHEAIAKDEAKSGRKPVSVWLGKRDVH